MSKLSGPMSDALSDLASYGVFQTGTRKQTITGLITRGLIIKTGDDDYSLTAAGWAELGTTAPVTVTDDERKERVKTIVGKVTVPGDMSASGPFADWEAELLGINPDRPYMVEMLYRDAWIIVLGTDSRTWGRANVLRMRMASKGSTNVRVVNTVENRICA